MDFNSLLNDVLSAGQKIVGGQQAEPQGALSALGFLNHLGLGGSNDNTSSSSTASGLLGMLLGNAGSLASMGSVAALGSMAFKAWQNWQGSSSEAPAGSVGVQGQGEIMLLAMIAAANADGVIDAREREAIMAQIGRDDDEVQAWLAPKLRNPPSPEQLAARIGNDKPLAAQAYLAARMVCAELDDAERAFLQHLAQALGLDDDFVAILEKEVRAQ